MSLWKIPVLVFLWVAHVKSIIPPNRPGSPDNNIKPASLSERFWAGIKPWRFLILYYTVTLFIVCAEEIAAILAAFSPSAVPSALRSHIVRVSPHSSFGAVSSPPFLIGMAIALAGAHLRIASFRALGEMFTLELSKRESDKLVTTGPYALVRHPSYTGLLVNALGVAIAVAGPGRDGWFGAAGVMDSGKGKVAVGIWLAGWLALGTFLTRRSVVEDSMLKKVYGKQWDQWARDVPYRLVPYVY